VSNLLILNEILWPVL